MKRLYRVQQGKQIGGVCAGLGKYFETDPVIFRVLFVFLTFFHGSGILLYIILMIVMPQEPQPLANGTQKSSSEEGQISETNIVQPQSRPSNGSSSFFAILIGVILILTGFYFLLEQFNVSFPFIHYYRRYFWENLIAFTLIISGLYFIFRRR